MSAVAMPTIRATPGADEAKPNYNPIAGALHRN